MRIRDSVAALVLPVRPRLRANHAFAYSSKAISPSVSCCSAMLRGVVLRAVESSGRRSTAASWVGKPDSSACLSRMLRDRIV
ncbi:hypothetical protein EAO74_17585 [Streptomyces sp. gb1(2016)]|uniref:Uncharacterized protein n=1 Tax=Streptomyces sp. gb1(2016) TaxID=1828321 RepID=A0A652KVD7_9ACTN|nr:hypothetical protein EAO74_17585 [Streptomyces sp. gb1(2016)]